MTNAQLVEELECTRTRLAEREAALAAAREQTALREAELLVKDAEIKRLVAENEHLKVRMDRMCRRMFGKSAERVSPEQLALAFAEMDLEQRAEDLLESAAGEETPETPKAPKASRKGGRTAAAKDLPRIRVEVEPPEAERVCACCAKPLVRIGEETSEQLEHVPASFHVVVTARGKWACASCKEGGVAIAPVPVTALARSVAGPGLVAHVVASKYADHLPLYRQEGIYARHGVALSRSTLKDLVAGAAEVLSPVAAAVLGAVLASRVVGSDDTPVTVTGVEGGSTTGRLWAYTGEKHEVAYDFTMNRSRDGPSRVLKDFRGFLQVDAYAGYDETFRRGGVFEVGCWAHARRYFVDALATDPKEAARVLALIQRLYAVEKKAKDGADVERLLARQGESKPILAQIRTELDQAAGAVLPKGPLGQAVTYARNNWTALTRYVEQGFLAIDNNRTERAIRGVAIGRKNWLFCGSEGSGHRTATLLTLVESCKLQGLDPYGYLRDVLVRVHVQAAGKIAELTPRRWKAARDAGSLPPLP